MLVALKLLPVASEVIYLVYIHILGLEGKQEVILLRANNTIELYDIENSTSIQGFNFITKYEVRNTKITEIVSIRMTWREKDLIVCYIPKDKVNNETFLQFL